MRKTLFIALSCAPLWAQAQSGAVAFSGTFEGICASASAGTALFARCQELNLSNDLAAIENLANGQALEQLPGQGRANAKPQSDGGAYQQALGEGWSVFASADLGQLDRKISVNEAAFDGSANRLTAGVNYQASPKLLLGLALNHSRDRLDFDQSAGFSHSRMNGALLNAAIAPNEHFIIDAYVGSFSGDTDNVREVSYQFSTPSGPFSVNALANSSFDIRRQVAGASGTWQWNRDGWSGGIQLGVDRAKTTLDGFVESGGSGFALRVPQREILSETGYLGFSATKTYSINWGVIAPSVRVNLRKEFENPSRTLSVILDEDKTQTPILFDTSDPDTQWGEVGVGVSLVMREGHQAFFEYRQRFNHSFLQERVIAIGWRKEF
jgi:Autotransporter beta-domain